MERELASSLEGSVSRFLTPLDVRVLRSRTLTKRPYFMVLSPLLYESELLGRTLVVPSWFQTDFASVPAAPLLYWLFGDVGGMPGVVHDYLCSEGDVPRKVADQVFYEALRAETQLPAYGVSDPSVPWLPARVMYLGVRIGAFLGIGSTNEKETA
jgi:hypothetical protein